MYICIKLKGKVSDSVCLFNELITRISYFLSKHSREDNIEEQLYRKKAAIKILGLFDIT